MKRVTLLILLTDVCLLCGCPRVPAGVELERFSFEGRIRSYLAHAPAGVGSTEPAPLLLVLHGFGETAASAVRATHFEDLADREGFIVVFPNAVRRTWRYHSADEAPGYLRDVDDVAFLSALIDRFKEQYRIDPQRVYAAGFSNGGFMVQRLACERPELVAGIAAVSAGATERFVSECAPSEPVSVLLMSGTEDPILPYNGGSVQMGPGNDTPLVPVEDLARFWAERNGCSTGSAVTELPDADSQDGTRVSLSDYGACTEGIGVVLYTVAGGGHAWPGGGAPYPERLVGRTSRDIDGPETVWAFFQAHPKPSSG